MHSQITSQTSPYWQQHENQPVNWMTWSPDTFQKAQEADKPILVSIGYSACHWCQEMSRNCFEDKYIASLMNRHFVCILVDREERPDLDLMYMEAVRMFNQSAGWPLNVFCLPDGRPFWGGTYFPREDLGNGLAPWPQVLMRVSEHYQKAKDELIENAENVISNLLHANHVDCSEENTWSDQLLINAVKKICSLHDDEFGGFTPAPKFPSPMKLDFLLSILESNSIRKNNIQHDRVKSCLKTSLNSLADGGIFDHIGGGFFRYSTNKEWSQPHYEKLLSDNALLLSTFARAYGHFNSPNYERVIRKTLIWLKSEIGSSSKGFSSSLSAESNGDEGAYYEWELTPMITCMEPENAKKYFEALPDQTSGRKLPQLINSKKFSIQEQLLWMDQLESGKSLKPKPSVDRKRILANNALLIRGYVDAAIVLQDISLLHDAISLEKWIDHNFIDQEFCLQSFIYPETEKSVTSKGNLDDYTFYAEALLKLASVSEIIETGSSLAYINKAISITESAITHFKDSKMAGFFFSDGSLSPPPPCRKKVWYDNATPSGNSSLLNVFLNLHHLTKEHKWRKEYEDSLTGYPKIAERMPEGIAHALSAISQEAIGKITIYLPPLLMEEAFKYLPSIINRCVFLSPQVDAEKGIQIKIGNSEKIWDFDQIDSMIKFLKEE